MNAERALNMIVRMLMRLGRKQARKIGQPESPNKGVTEDRRTFRGTRPEGEAAKRVQNIKDLHKER